MKKIDDIFLNSLPSIDLHGYTKDMASLVTEDFIQENYLLRNNKFIIIHGIGSGAVKTSVHNVLNKSKYVKEYKLVSQNVGCTIVTLKDNITKKY